MQTSRNVFRRHPFLCGFVILVVLFFAFARWAELTAPPPKKLDYTKPIVTGEGAIVCPQSLLFDLRSDHGPDAVFSAFTAISNRTEKVHAIGCEEIRGGLPVIAHRMFPPNEDYVAVTFRGALAAGEFFTMEGDLENPEEAVPLAQPAAIPLPQPPVAPQPQPQSEPPAQQVEIQDAKPLPSPDANETPTPEQQPSAPIERRPPQD
jgi:hypothetical protein